MVFIVFIMTFIIHFRLMMLELVRIFLGQRLLRYSLIVKCLHIPCIILG